MKKIYKNVSIGKNANIGESVIIGCPPQGKKDGDLKTVIGDNCTVRSGTILYAGNTIGNNFCTGHNTVIREENKIGNDVSIGTLTCVEHHVEIKDGVRIHSQAFVPEYSILEEASWIGPNVVFTNALHPQCPKVKKCLKGPHVKRGAKIGANSTLLPYIVIGEGALIGAGSVVVRDIPKEKVACGNPARIIKKTNELKCKQGLTVKPYGQNERKK
ncbi:MAG: transferase [Candidatus Omnitrophica bacterium]|nr:transferase [Candidatus Omnitrophota bacterium]